MFVIFIVEFVSDRDSAPPTVKPPLKVLAVLVEAPRPVTDDRVSDSEVELEEMVIVEPEDVIEEEPEPLIVKVPVRSLTLVTTAVVSSPIVGLWPAETVMPPAPTAPYKTFGAVMFSAKTVKPET